KSLCGRSGGAHATPAHRSDGLHRSALSSAPSGGRNRGDRPDARRPDGAWPRAGDPSGLLPPVRARLQLAQIAHAGVRRLPTRRLRRTAALLVPWHGIPYRERRACRAAIAEAASTVVDDEPRSEDTRILREERHQSGLLTGLS